MDKKNIDSIQNDFVPLFEKFNKVTKKSILSLSEKNAVLYNVIEDIIDSYIKKLENKTKKEIMKLRLEYFKIIIDKWKELDPSLDIDDEVMDSSNEIKKNIV